MCSVNLWGTRENLVSAPSFNDTVLHQQMIQFATRSFQHLQSPFTHWYPYLNGGSPHFLHYQGLGASVTGLLGVITGPNFAFRLSVWLLVGLWPLAIYSSARIFGLKPGPSLFAAVLSPALSSVPQIGFEAHAYLWLGYGVWAQLWASWALPFAWAWTWRALQNPKHLWKAALGISLTASFHYETGYLAFLGVGVLVLVQKRDFLQRLGRGMILVATAIVGTSWVLVPLLTQARWAAINSGQNTTNWALGYGARTNFGWLISGKYFDNLRWPVISLLLGIAIALLLIRWRTFPVERAIFVLTTFIFLLSFGPTTWGSLIHFVPGYQDIFFRRFLGAAQLGGLLLAGSAPFMLRSTIMDFRRHRQPDRVGVPRGLNVVFATIIVSVSVGITSSAWCYYAHNARAENYQISAQASQSTSMAAIVDYLHKYPDARVYAGTPANWGRKMTYGVGPAYMYLADCGIAQISTEAWSAALLEVPQEMFVDSNLSDYQIFNVQYILMPKSTKPPIPANLVLSSGPYALWKVPNVGPFSVLSDSGYLEEGKATIVSKVRFSMRTHLFEQHAGFYVKYGGASSAVQFPEVPSQPVGSVVSYSTSLVDGTATSLVRLSQPGALVLSASFDPGWHVSVDGQPAVTEMLAPALVAVHLRPGLHTVTFSYKGFSWYLPLFLLSISAFVVVGRRYRDFDDHASEHSISR